MAPVYDENGEPVRITVSGQTEPRQLMRPVYETDENGEEWHTIS